MIVPAALDSDVARLEAQIAIVLEPANVRPPAQLAAR